MRRTLPTVAAAAITLLLPLAPAGAQETVRLTRPVATSTDGYSAIAGLRVLSDGRLVVADALEQTLSIVSLERGAERIGRQGSGPGEYGMPGQLFAGAGDTTYMLDMGNRRLLVITPQGRILSETIPLRQPDGSMVPLFPRGMDARGRVYFDLMGIMMPGLEQMAREGKAPLLRWDRETNRVDTLGYLNFPAANVPATRPGEMRVQIGGGGNPFDPRDQWAVTPDGRVGIARAAGEYRVEWVGANPAAGPAIRYDPVRVTDAEKNAWADQVAQRGIMMSVENGRRSTRRAPRPDVSQMQWPERMPPFTGQAVLAATNGELWVERARSARTTERTYDVFDAQGRRVKQVVLPAGGNVRWTDGRTVIATREDADGLQWIERYVM